MDTQLADVTQPLLVFPHLPKTAGSSFVESLRQHFGNARTLQQLSTCR